MHPIQAILFDLDGTLRHNRPSGDQVFARHLRELGLRLSGEAQTRALRWEHYYFAHSPEIRADLANYPAREDFWLNFAVRRLVALGIDPRRAAELAPGASAFMAEHYQPEPHVPPEVFSLLASFQECGYILGVVSNRDGPFHEELKALRLDSYFRFALAGGEVDSFKPEARIFEHALALAGTAAAETIYVGDNYFADIVGARRAGLHPVLLDPDGLFPEAGCAVIRSFRELPALLT